MKIWDDVKKLRHWREMWWDLRHRKTQTRVAPYGTRGRTHVLANPGEQPVVIIDGRDTPIGGNHLASRGKFTGTISARIQRAGSDEWEDLGVLAGPEETEVKDNG